MDSAVVTLRFETGMSDLDVELPTQVSVRVLCPFLADTLRQLRPQCRTGYKAIQLWANGAVLEEQTLASCGLWDGSILWVKEVTE